MSRDGTTASAENRSVQTSKLSAEVLRVRAFKTAATEGLADAVELMDRLHEIGVAADAWAGVANMSSKKLKGFAAVKAIRSTECGALRTGADLLTDTQQNRLIDVFDNDKHAEVEATWSIYQDIVEASRNSDPVNARSHG